MLAVIGQFRIPVERLAEARPLMAKVIEATRAEKGCLSYSYAEDVTEPGLFRVNELWECRDDLAAHFETRHMRDWANQRLELGFTDREIIACNVDQTERL